MSHLHRSMHRALVRLEENPCNMRVVQAECRNLRDLLHQLNDADARARIARKDVPWTDPSFQRRVAALLMAVANPESCTPAITAALPARAQEMLDELQGHVPPATPARVTEMVYPDDPRWRGSVDEYTRGVPKPVLPILGMP